LFDGACRLVVDLVVADERRSTSSRQRAHSLWVRYSELLALSERHAGGQRADTQPAGSHFAPRAVSTGQDDLKVRFRPQS